MAVKIGDNDVNFCIGDNEIDRIYLGDVEIWSNGPVLSFLSKIIFPDTITSLSFVEGNNNG